jgi:chemosensory pili system protein ChpA (sensor histidine kinase/response regulator)
VAVPGDDEAELRMIFLEEAVEVLETISEMLLSVQRAFDNADHLGVLRRCFHTLKGSARMIGLGEFGEAAHRVEHLLNLRLSGGAANVADLYPLMWRAHAEFSDWIAELARDGRSARSAEEFWRVVAAGDLAATGFVDDSGANVADEGESLAAHGSADETEASPAVAEVKQIGALEMSMPLYAIYRSETKGLLRILSRDLLDWRRQPDRYVSIPAVHAVHSLAGSSATVGLPPVHQIAFAIEAIMQHQVRKPVRFTEDEFAVLDAGIARIGAMLEGVAGGQMPAADPETVDGLQRVLDAISKRADAWLEQPDAAFFSVRGPAPETEPQPEPVSAQILPPLPPLPILAMHADDDTALHDAPDADLLALFIEEARDIMPLFGQTLRDWRRHPQDASQAQGLLRMTHTLKGSARMAGAMRLGQHMHAMETQIEESLQGQPLMAPNFDALLLQHDRALQLYEQLLTLSAGSEGSDAVEREETAEMAASAAGAISAAAPLSTPLVRVRADILDRLVNQAGEVSISRSKLETEVASLHLLLADLNDNVARLRQQLRELEMQAEAQMGLQISPQINPQTSNAVEREFDALEFDRYTRLQELTRMMAESVDDVGTVQQGLSSSLASASMGLTAQGRLTRDLQQDLMRVRMVPFGSLSDRLYRVVRQTARDIGKRVTLELRGSSLEVDRSVLDRMAAPFEHLLRNAIVHGIEAAEVRRAAGKPETGELQVAIHQEGNEVVLQFADDGAGLDMAAVRARAVAEGMLDAAHEPTDAELIELIFNSGFSTAASLSQTAGRGVGMDAVRSEVARLGGTVAVASESGLGMRVTIRLPLTLAITQVVLVSAAGRTYALPSILVEQVLQLKSEPFASACDEGAVQWQSQRVGMLYLSHLLGDRQATPLRQQYASVVILKNGLQRIAVHVDELQGNREVVVKNVGAQLAGVAGISGATVLGSGEIVLILNPLQLVQRLQQRPAPGQSGHADVTAPVARPAIVMVVDDSMTVRRVTQRLLVREGYQVVLAKDGVDALERLQSVIPDVMLVDIEMPRMDGFDLTRNVRDDARTRALSAWTNILASPTRKRIY